MATASVSGRVTSPTTTSASGGSRRALPGLRTRARTAWPCRIASSTTRCPMLPVAPTTSTMMRGMIMASPSCSASQRPPRSRPGDLIDDPQPVERAGIPDEWQELGQDVDEPCAVVADVEVCGDMAFDLRFASTERDEHTEGEQLACRQVDTGARVVIAKAVCRQIVLDVHLAFGRGCVKLLDNIAADNPLFDRKPLLFAVLRRGRGLRREGQLHASLGEHIVGGVDEIEDLCH